MEKLRHSAILVLTVILSLGGIILCSYVHRPDDGGRGGAIAVAFSFGSLFLNQPYGKDIYKFLTRTRRRQSSQTQKLENDLPNTNVWSNTELLEKLEALDKKLEALDTRLDVDIAGQELQNTFLALSAIVGTIAWGFGDWASTYLLKFF